MAITAQSFVILASPGSPTALTPGGAPAFSFGSVQEPFAQGTVTFTGDGATTAAVVNWIDGVQTLPFTPSAVLAFIVGGTDTVGVLRAAGGTVSAVTNVSATVNYSTAVANTATSKLIVIAYK